MIKHPYYLLLNAGKTTNFIYQLKGEFSDSDIQRINSLDSRSKIKDRIQAIYQQGGNLIYSETENAIFNSNLVLIDSLLPNLLAGIVQKFYATNLSTIADLVAEIEKENPLHFNNEYNHQYYQYKVKKLLTEIAVGMMPATVWQGIYDATGGYLIVKEDGDILAYHLYNRNEFEDYLFHNTKLDTASSSRHDFGQIYKDKGHLFMKLNLQVRFIK